MARIHYLCLFRNRDEYVVLHPSCELESLKYAASLPVHAVGRIRTGKTHGYAVENTPVLWKLMRRNGDTVCAACTKASCDADGYSADKKPVGEKGARIVPCPEVVWDEKWIQATGMSRFQTVPEWEKIWERVADRVADTFLRENEPPAVPNAVHEQVLGIVPPYDYDAMIRAYKAAALRAHPDIHGGSHEAMVRVNAAKDALKLSLGC